jgi:hypothetical protein
MPKTDAQIAAEADAVVAATGRVPPGVPTTAKPAGFDFAKYASKVDPLKDIRQQLTERREEAEGDKKRDLGLAIAGIGARIAGGKSQYALANIGEGLAAGLPELRKIGKDARERKDKDIALSMSVAAADQQAASAEREFAFKVHRGEMTDEQASEGLAIRRGQLKATIINTATASRDRARLLKESIRSAKAREARPSASVELFQMFRNLDDPKDRADAIRFFGKANTTMASQLKTAITAWAKIKEDVGEGPGTDAEARRVFLDRYGSLGYLLGTVSGQAGGGGPGPSLGKPLKITTKPDNY